MPLEFSSNIGGQDLLDSLADEYSKSKKPIEVNFREYAAVSSEGRRTHLIHPYPAKLLAKIPQFFLSCEKLVPTGSTLLDPFCGSGTVLFEGQLAGLTTVGADSNPLARLITSAKLEKVDIATARSELQSIMQAIPSAKTDIPDVVNRSHWYSERISNELGCLRSAISDNVSRAHRSFFDVCFSATCKRVSYADPRLSVPVKINPDRSQKYGAKGAEVIQKLKRLETLDATSVFWSVATQNIKRKSETEDNFPLRSANFKVLENAMQLDLPDNSIDLVMTSPPYVGAQKYVRASSLSLGWLGLTPGAALRQYEKVSIGREHLMKEEVWTDETIVSTADNVIKRVKKENPLRARIAQWYLLEMRQAINEIHRVLKKDGHLVLIAGPNMVAGQYFDALYAEPLQYKSKENTSFSIGFMSGVRPIHGFEGSPATGSNPDFLILGMGYDDRLLASVAENKEKADKHQLFGLPSLRADMYQESVIRSRLVADELGDPDFAISNRSFAPANDPFGTASALAEIVSKRKSAFPDGKIILSPLGTKAQVLGFALYYILECEEFPASIIFPFSSGYAAETSTGLARAWRYKLEFD